MRTVQQTGAAANRVDMVFLGDGYTAAELAGTYAAHVDNYVSYLFGGGALTDPFSRYRNFFNIYAVDVVSQQSGADDPTAGLVRNTALGASYLGDGVTQRLLTIDGALTEAAATAGLAGTGITAEMRYVTVNAAQYGGSGGGWSVFAGGNDSAREVALHEAGHSFAHLGDEYGGTAATYSGAEPAAVNITKDPTGAKWAEWLGYNDPTLGAIGAFNGGGYFDSGIYRPTAESKMRSLGRPFDAIAREEFIHGFYALVDPLDGHDPNAGTRTELRSLSVDTIDPAVIQVDWTVNGQVFSNAGERFDLEAYRFDGGSYTVTARAYDPTPWVRGDRSDLEQVVTWQVTNSYGGPNLLVGTAAAERLQGGGGDDTLSGLGGADTLSGDSGYDIADYRASAAGVSVSLASGNGWSGDATGDVLATIESLIGSPQADFLAGNDDHNIIEGGAGADVVQGQGGNDWISFENAAGAIAVNLASLVDSGWAGDATGDDITTIENIRGSAFGDYLYGDAGANILRGDAGGDVLYGAGNSDTIYYSTSPFSVSVDLSSNSATGGDAQGDVLVSVENVFGTAFGDVLVGDSASNTLVGWLGIDMMAGNGGNDIFRWSALGESGTAAGTRDLVTDFYRAHGDLLDFSGIDANANLAGDQAFAFIGFAAFSATGQLRYTFDGLGSTIIELNAQGSLAADMAVQLTGQTNMAAIDFIL